jgi:hypothetical protein
VSRSLLSIALLTLSLPILASAPPDLQVRTRQDFDRYAAATVERVVRESQPEGSFLYLQHASSDNGAAALSRLRRGELIYEHLETRDGNGEEMGIHDGLIHHWLGAAFVQGVGVEEALELIQDSSRHAEIYPEVEQSRLLRQNGDTLRSFLRFRKHKVITVVMNTEHEARFVRVAPDRAYSLSHSTRVQEVEDAGTSSERELPEGEGHGFMWSMNSSWRFLERDGGTYIESESITLTRTIPFLLRWIVGPFVNDVPRQSLQSLLEITRDELMANR